MEKNVAKKDLLCVIGNYGFSHEADLLKARLGSYLPTLLIDNCSPTPPQSADHILPNLYYPGLWNSAVKLALERNAYWLMFVASDVEIPRPELLAERVSHAIRKWRLGIYTPALTQDSRLAYPQCYDHGTGDYRECYISEGFFFLARTSILREIYPIDSARNKYGWGIDALACYHAYRRGLRVMVDDAVTIRHPKAIHDIDATTAQQQCTQYLGDAARHFLRWADRQAKDTRAAARNGHGLRMWRHAKWLIKDRTQGLSEVLSRRWLT